MRLINNKTGKEVNVGDEVTTFRGYKGVLKSFNERRVYVRLDDGIPYNAEYFPDVIDCKVVE